MTKNVNNFDFYRFVASGLVLITHCYAFKGLADNTDWFGLFTNGHFPFSYIGVQVFFYISGYLILSSFNRSPNVLNYLIKRCLRIFPGLIGLLIVCVLLLGPLLTTMPLEQYFSDPQTYLFFKNVSLYRLNGTIGGLFATNPQPYEVIGTLWTLAYEFTCYLSLLILAVISMKRLKYVVVIYAIVGTTLMYIPIYFNQLPQTIPFLELKLIHFVNFTSCFAIGMLFYVYKSRISLSQKHILILVVAFFALITTQIYPLIYLAVKVIFPLLLFSAANIKSKLNGINKWGDPSYGVYIYGFPIQQTIIFYAGKDISMFVFMILSVLLSYTAGYLSWHLVEKHALKWKNFSFESLLSTKTFKKVGFIAVVAFISACTYRSDDLPIPELITPIVPVYDSPIRIPVSEPIIVAPGDTVKIKSEVIGKDVLDTVNIKPVVVLPASGLVPHGTQVSVENVSADAKVEYSVDNGKTWFEFNAVRVGGNVSILIRQRIKEKVSANTNVVYTTFFKRVIIVGNSILQHDPLPERGWNGSWGMAASAPDKDFLRLISSQLRSLNSEVKIETFQGVNFEKNYKTFDFSSLSYLTDLQADLIIIRIGDNVSSNEAYTNGFSNYYRKLVQKISEKNEVPPKLICTSTFLQTALVDDQMLIGLREPIKAIWVDLNKIRTAQSNLALAQYSDVGIGSHPSDAGMKAISDSLWNAINPKVK